MRRLVVVLLALGLVFALCACDNATPVLAGTPTPAATPTPLPDAFSAEITAEPLPTRDSRLVPAVLNADRVELTSRRVKHEGNASKQIAHARFSAIQ